MFCVMAGKMSEGINFENQYARCVVIVGIPYGNLTAGELKHKLAYLNELYPRTNTGDEYYINSAMKKVNQSIGRAFRHANDYAAIILLDFRFLDTKTKKYLPSWITESIQDDVKEWKSLLTGLRRFFESIKN